MARAYSQDVRERVINAVARDGIGCRAAARHFEVSAAAAVKWVQRYRRLGDRRNAGTGGHRPSKLQPHRAWLVAVIEAQPDITLAACCPGFLNERGVRADTGMWSRFFTAEGIRFKQKRAAWRTGSARRQAQARKLAALSGAS